jgi:hypothetical protein
MLEIPASVEHHPLAVEFCLMSGFRFENTGSKIKMISCDTVSSIFAKVSSIQFVLLSAPIQKMLSQHMGPHLSLLYVNLMFSILFHRCSVKFAKCIVDSQNGGKQHLMKLETLSLISSPFDLMIGHKLYHGPFF